jgi:hypothetical protein
VEINPAGAGDHEEVHQLEKDADARSGDIKSE